MTDAPKTAADELVGSPQPAQPLDITKLNAGDPIELARLEQMSMQTALTDAQRLQRIANGQRIDTGGVEATANGQLTNRDFSSAVAGLLDDGMRPELILRFLETGKSDVPRGHEYAQQWLDQLASDPEKQAKLLRGDPELRRQLANAAGLIAGRHDKP